MKERIIAPPKGGIWSVEKSFRKSKTDMGRLPLKLFRKKLSMTGGVDSSLS